MEDILGKALTDYLRLPGKHKLWVHNRYGNKEEMPITTYFRKEDEMPDLEWLALEECAGSVLDIGAAAGSHCLALQARGLDVTALDLSPGAANVMRIRGVKHVIKNNIFLYRESKFDTLLLLMNGIGLAATTGGLDKLLLHLKTLLNPGGQILFDSSDVKYVYQGIQLPEEQYYGEIWYRYEYKKRFSDWFSWLYADEQTMSVAAAIAGFNMDVLVQDEFGQYLGRLT